MIQRYLYHLRLWWWLVAAAAVLAGVIGFVVTASSSPSYSATTTILVRVSPSSGPLVLDDILVAERLANTYTELIKTRPVLDDAVAALGGPETVKDLESQVNARAIANSQLIEITAATDEPDRAAKIADTVAEAFVKRMNETAPAPEDPPTDPGTTGETSQSSLVIVERAEAPDAGDGASDMIKTVAGMLAGASLMLIVIAGRAYFDDTIWSPEDARAAGIRVPCLGVIPVNEIGGGTILNDGRSIPALTEQCRTMAATVFSALAHIRGDDNSTQSVALVSSARGEGRTSLVARLGVAASIEGNDATLIDFDLPNPELHKEFRIANGFGVTDVLWLAPSRPRPLAEASKEVMDHLKVIPGGQYLFVSTMRFNGTDIAAAVNPLKGNNTDFIFFDTSPMSEGGDAVLLGEILDAAIIVVEARKTTTDTLSSLNGQMEALGLSVLGYILNKR